MIKMDVTVSQPDRRSLDKNGSWLPNFGFGTTDYTWAGLGAAATGTSSLFSNTNYGTWSYPVQKKFTPKKCKKPGFRD